MVERSDSTSLPHVLIEVVEAVVVVDFEEVEVGVISVAAEVGVAAVDSEGVEGAVTLEEVVEAEAVVVEEVAVGSTVKQRTRTLALSRPSREPRRPSMIEELWGMRIERRDCFVIVVNKETVEGGVMRVYPC